MLHNNTTVPSITLNKCFPTFYRVIQVVATYYMENNIWHAPFIFHFVVLCDLTHDSGAQLTVVSALVPMTHWQREISGQRFPCSDIHFDSDHSHTCVYVRVLSYRCTRCELEYLLPDNKNVNKCKSFDKGLWTEQHNRKRIQCAYYHRNLWSQSVLLFTRGGHKIVIIAKKKEIM